MKKNKIHLKAPDNWINDPNGFIYYNGKYHLFYQYFPFAPHWGTIHWGHAESNNLVDWEHKGIAIYPSKTYDKNGVFSGSALEKDGKLYLYYSGVHYIEENPENIHIPVDDKYETSQVLLISEDGQSFDNEQGKMVIIPPILCNENKVDATRDPKVWEQAGIYYMILGGSQNGKVGKILVYRSEDAVHWKCVFQKLLATYGYAIECPDIFWVNGQQVFMCCAMGINKSTKEYANHAVCTIAKTDVDTGVIEVPDTYRMVDYGGDLYAPQTNLDEEGRRVMIAWIRMPQSVTDEAGDWNGLMCIPRVVNVKDDHIYFQAHPNIRACFEKAEQSEDCIFKGYPLRINTCLREKESLNIGGYKVRMEDGKIIADRSAVFVEDEQYEKVSFAPCKTKEAKLEIYVDSHLIEIFINDGESVLSNVVYQLGTDIEGKVDEVAVLKEKKGDR